MKFTRIHYILIVVTTATTFISGYLLEGSIISGISFSISLMLILGAHEMGHYYYGKKYNASISPPYFIPAPPFISPIGTFGAFIKIKSRMFNKKELFDIGVAGPIWGVIVAIPVLIAGLYLSEVVSVNTDAVEKIESGLALGDSLIFLFFTKIIFGEIKEGYEVFLHPVAFAGWIGLFVTALNLIPSGQLDGGHIVYSVFPRNWHLLISKISVAILIVMGFGTESIFFLVDHYNLMDYSNTFLVNLRFQGWMGWLLWGIILTLLGTKHPPTFYDEIDIGIKRKVVALISLLIFVLCFTPVPIKVVEFG
ncbi:MAG: site-2 protease family protein [Candidatus Dadabacteria bacterium]|nr:site-2 protease family protein [Candidatus Dadabacteria bacterium]NIQ14099.1 site-2 protease family protein [Candidatus Dadabacteria bacterium]